MLIIFLLSPQVFVSCKKERCNALWCVNIGGSGDEPVLGDVDGDGVKDVVVGLSDGNILPLEALMDSKCGLPTRVGIIQ